MFRSTRGAQSASAPTPVGSSGVTRAGRSFSERSSLDTSSRQTTPLLPLTRTGRGGSWGISARAVLCSALAVLTHAVLVGLVEPAAATV
eukprot:2622561-Alexandrium_andersonii.AAC.1